MRRPSQHGTVRAGRLRGHRMVRMRLVSANAADPPLRLISASVGTIVHYGFGCHTNVGKSFMGLCLATGLAGNVFPFMAWFNKHEYRVRMILSSNHTAIYVGARSSIALGFSWCLRSRASRLCSRCRCCIRGRRCTASSVRRSSCALPPLTAHRCFTRSASPTGPVVPSLLSYLIGLAFYAAHFPERVIPANIQRKLDVIGGSTYRARSFIIIAGHAHALAHEQTRTRFGTALLSSL